MPTTLLGITRNVMRTLLKRHGLLHDSVYVRGSSEQEWGISADARQ